MRIKIFDSGEPPKHLIRPELKSFKHGVPCSCLGLRRVCKSRCVQTPNISRFDIILIQKVRGSPQSAGGLH